MKKQFTLITALALCMGLAAPAMAAKTYTFGSLDDGNVITISNTIKDEPWDGGGLGVPITCVAPVEITTIMELVSFDVVTEESIMTDNYDLQEFEILNKKIVSRSDHVGHEIMEAGAKVVLTEPGSYVVSYSGCDETHDRPLGGSGFVGSYWITIVDNSDEEDTHSFTDVPADAYFANPVKWAVEKKITAGTTPTTFSPEVTCSHAHILTFLWNAAGCPEPTVSNPFTNISANDYYYKAALWAYENGMLSGNTFDGNLPCTRSETVTYMWQAAGKPSVTKETTFTDVAGDAAYVQAVAWAVDAKVTAGTSATTFSPDATCTRGQIVTFLYNAFAGK